MKDVFKNEFEAEAAKNTNEGTATTETIDQTQSTVPDTEMRRWMDKHIGPHIARLQKKGGRQKEIIPSDQTTKDLITKLKGKSQEWKKPVSEIAKHTSHPMQILVLTDRAKQMGLLS